MLPCTHSQTCYRCNEEALQNVVREERGRTQHSAGIDYYFFPSWTQGSTTQPVEEARGQQGKKLSKRLPKSLPMLVERSRSSSCHSEPDSEPDSEHLELDCCRAGAGAGAGFSKIF